jgi:hypothetical protein
MQGVVRRRAMDAKLAELEAGRDLSRTWLHVDMWVGRGGPEGCTVRICHGRWQHEIVLALLWSSPT